jgi:hypothetical protein
MYKRYSGNAIEKNLRGHGGKQRGNPILESMRETPLLKEVKDGTPN